MTIPNKFFSLDQSAYPLQNLTKSIKFEAISENSPVSRQQNLLNAVVVVWNLSSNGDPSATPEGCLGPFKDLPTPCFFA